MPHQPAVTVEDVHAAFLVVTEAARETPLYESAALNDAIGGRVLMKCENFQRTGAFKFRGAWNAITRLKQRYPRASGVLTWSSGNHAAALALAGRMNGVSVTIVMPENAPRVKREAAKANGGEIVFYDPAKEAREIIGRGLAEERGLTIIPPYDHPDVIAGQGTAALEMLNQSTGFDTVLVPVGGGGLISGTATAFKALAPKCRIIGVEPANADDATRSFRTGKLHTVSNPDTIADGARTPSLGEYTFPIVLEKVDEMVTVSEQGIRLAMKLLWEKARLLVEPCGALPLAALLENAVEPAGGRTGIIISGGNTDLDTAVRLIAEADASG